MRCFSLDVGSSGEKVHKQCSEVFEGNSLSGTAMTELHTVRSCLSVCLSVHLLVCLFVHLFVCLSVCLLSVCLSLCVWFASAVLCVIGEC